MGCRYYYASNLNSLTEAPTDGCEFKLVIKLTLEILLILYLFNVTFPDCSNHICSCLETKELKYIKRSRKSKGIQYNGQRKTTKYKQWSTK